MLSGSTIALLIILGAVGLALGVTWAAYSEGIKTNWEDDDDSK